MKHFAVLLLLFILMSCSSKDTGAHKDSTADSSLAEIDSVNISDTTWDEPDPNPERPNKGEIEAALVGIVPGYEVMDFAVGDLNGDSLNDMLVVMHDPQEDSFPDRVRPLLILIANEDYEYTIAARNDNVVLCAGCGEEFGDPYDKLTIKNGFFSVEQYSGSDVRWSRIITFKYHPDKKMWYLHRDAGESYPITNPDVKTEVVTNKSDFGKLSFLEFDSNKK